MKYRYVAIEGIIGTGKTSLAQKFSSDFNGKLLLEEFDENPFLPLFYEEPQRYGFPVEMSFLAERYHQIKSKIQTKDLFQPIFSDYIFEKSLLFAHLNLSEDEYALYKQIFKIITNSLPAPEVTFFLYKKPEIALENIKKRGRSYEQNITIDYLDDLQSQYIGFFKQKLDWRVIFIDSSNLDFVSNNHDYDFLCSLLNREFNEGITRIIP
ncbi:deoxynucleoside kinase [Salibacter sp.]|jgi:deoxyadenosine/deoxycytidine kinase|uniref:deoxynucleoside kinase n=1 Tax=Salibacter sp. TaxID=2010995 RepID=UPI00286FDA55|nr:deoxynucleoside kinase [Salibacter sp.]MDR9399451.1 deoxynucleoside kinase [Salibacter sp.]MDR9488408.1 deoxynucleoside kinase [Salibacter sp.]